MAFFAVVLSRRASQEDDARGPIDEIELPSANVRSVPAWLAFRRPILPTSPFLYSLRVSGS